MNEQEYFRRAAGTRIKQTQESQKSKQEQPSKEEPELLTESTQEIEKPKRGRKKKEIQEKPEPPKMPVYEFDRDESGKPVTKNLKKEIKGLNEQNFEIENNALDQFSNTIQKMINEEYDKLSRCKVEIKITEKMYNLYNKDIYKTQLKNLKDRQLQCITRIRLLNELKEDE
jgi:hypothetical protein